MKRYIRNIAVLISPILLMIVVNEMVRPTIVEKPYSKNGISAINSIERNVEKCTWICHNNTSFFKKYHVKYLKPYYRYTDFLYFGIINFLHKTGNYVMANIIFLVIILPLSIWFFIIKSMNIQDEITKLKNQK